MMTKIKTLCVFAVLILMASLSATARQLTATDALARLRANRVGMAKVKADENLLLVYTAKSEGKNLFYLFANEINGKRAIVSADDLMPALLAYDIQPFEVDEMPAHVSAWFEYYRQVVTNVVASGKEYRPRMAKGNCVAPLIKTKWNQHSPFNTICSEKTGIIDVATGCVATAMAQVLYYWKHPAQGSGTHSYTWNDKTLKTDFGKTNYLWDNICENYGEYYPDGEKTIVDAEYTYEQGRAVAELLYHCGVACEMEYSEDGSLASTFDTQKALCNYFGYDNSVKYLKRMWFNDEEWQQVLIDELATGRPILYAGDDSSNGGHSFICDGFDGEGYFHFNWGWSGSCDGYYVVFGNDACTPVDQVDGSIPYSFCLDNKIIVGIQPKKDNSKSELTIGMDAAVETTQGKTNCVLRDALSNELTDSSFKRATTYCVGDLFFNFSGYNSECVFGAILRNKESGREYVCSNSESFSLPSKNGYSIFEVSFDAVAENGLFEMFPAYREIKDGYILGEWRKIYADASAKPYLVNIDGELPTLTLTDSKLSGANGCCTTDPELMVKVKALSDVSGMQLTAYVYNSDDEQVNAFSFPSAVTLKAGEEYTFENLKLRNGRRDKALEKNKRYRVKLNCQNHQYNLGDARYSMLCFKVNDAIANDIQDVEVNSSHASQADTDGIYNMYGQRVTTPRHGIYIKDGKKVFVK